MTTTTESRPEQRSDDFAEGFISGAKAMFYFFVFIATMIWAFDL